MGLLAAGTRDAPLSVRRGWEMQQLTERRGSRLMHRRPDRHLDGVQIRTPRFAERIVEDDAKQLVYLENPAIRPFYVALDRPI